MPSSRGTQAPTTKTGECDHEVTSHSGVHLSNGTGSMSALALDVRRRRRAQDRHTADAQLAGGGCQCIDRAAHRSKPRQLKSTCCIIPQPGLMSVMGRLWCRRVLDPLASRLGATRYAIASVDDTQVYIYIRTTPYIYTRTTTHHVNYVLPQVI